MALIAVFASAPAHAERVFRLNEAATGEIDPAKASDLNDTVIAVNLYETLVYPRRGASGVDPMLASDWTIDGLTYTFTLRDGAKFASGNPVTAADVVYSYERMVGIGKGLSSLFAGRIASAEAVDPRTVRFTLTEPYAPFLASLVRLPIVDSTTAIANQQPGDFGDRGDWSQAWLGAHSEGSGAYMIEKQDPQLETDMVRNPNYTGTVDPLAPDRVRYRYGIEPATQRALISRGEHDMSDQFLPPEVARAMQQEGVAHLETDPGATVNYVKLNTQRAPLDDVNCRRALAYAYDYATTQQLLQVTPDLSLGRPVLGPLPKGILGADLDLPPLVQDMAKAKEALAACKYDPADYPLDIAWISESPNRERTALVMQATFAQLGFKVNVARTPWALLTDQVTRPETAPHAVEISVMALTPDPDSMLWNMYHSSVPYTWMSASYLKDENVDRLLEAGREETDEAKRADIYRQLGALLRELSPDIFAYESTGVYAVRTGVELPDLASDETRYPLLAYSLLFKDVQITD